MDIVVVRQATTIDSSSNVASPQFTGTPSANNTIIAFQEGWDSGGDAAPGSCADDASGGSNSYSSVIYAEHASQNNNCEVFRATVVNTLSNLTVTITSSTGNVLAASAIEVSGLGSTDIATSVVNDSASPWLLASGALAQPDALVLAGFSFAAGGLGSWGITIDQWNGVTPTTLFVIDGAGINSEYGAYGYRIVSSVASITASFSASDNGTGPSPVVLAVFKAASPLPKYDTFDNSESELEPNNSPYSYNVLDWFGFQVPSQAFVKWFAKEFDVTGENVYTLNPGGTITYSGAAALIKERLQPASGLIEFNGSAPLIRERILVPTGDIVFSGTAPITFTSGNTYIITPTGGITYSGVADYVRERLQPASGVLTFDGTSALLRTRVQAPTGGIEFSGAAPLLRTRVQLAAGSIVFSGSAPITFTPAGGGVGTDHLYNVLGYYMTKS